ncbi:hypothetical protein [Methylocystis sp. ATCC 49242]|uniref:hypothetical protein n=1 Tax=Methylocystis sp. ATCC 49242 TaxID=622637 RepID=UPI001FCB6CA8|nr:hypothetical protein [Methylocystis sp. ATCC 49242]
MAALAASLLSPQASTGRDAIAETKQRSAAAQFSPRDLPADRDGASLLTIPAAGRYSIRAKSPAGARIELVDMIAGPMESAGAAGLRDGRIDALLDKGVYKIRVAGAKGASGKVTLAAEPFAEMEASRPSLVQGKVENGELGDLQQRSYTLDVNAGGPVYLEAVGRSLRDLRVWQSDGALVDLAFERGAVETKPGRYMTRLRLEGPLSPGRYVVTAYGGEKLVWSDGATTQPFMLRLADPALLAAGVAEGVIGPFGAARFEAPASYDAFRLELPEQKPARLDARRGSARDTTIIDKTSRAPVAIARVAADGKASARLEISGLEGQTFNLRAVHQSNRETFEAEGPHLVSIDVAGEGGDEAPATALLARLEKDGKTRVIASDAPRIGVGKAWRGRFNVLGSTSLLFEATRDGPVEIAVKGVKLRATIEPALGTSAPRADGKDAIRYDLAAGYYFLMLEPQNGSGGVVDVTLGPPGLAAPAPTAPPSRASISFGEHRLEKDGSYLILANVAPGLLTGPRVVALPAELDKAPLALHQDANKEISLATRTPKAGKTIARDETGADVALTFADEKIENDKRVVTVKIAPVEKDRAIGLVFIPDAPATDGGESAKIEDTGKIVRAAAGRPAFFNLAQDETKNLRFDVAEGGLYRIETLGRMKTALRVGATATPRLGEGEANGPGKNGLVTTFLRAGAYRAAVTAKESAGHLGLSITPAILTPTAKVTDAGGARATLEPGKGAVVPFEITKAGDYRIDLLGLKREWRARIEDADGWPLAPPGKFKRETRRYEPGAYRLVVTPEDVEARMVMRLTPVVAAADLEGHGPHALPFEKPQRLQWREPQTKDAPRAPDVWRFTLHGDSDVELTIGEGMIGDIVKGEKESIGKVVGDRPFKGKLAAGDYRVDAHSLSHDDRLDYEISLTSEQLQPDAPRRVDLPATLAFSLAHEAIVDVTGFGDEEAIGVLKNATGDIVERLQTRADDWNVAMSRRLPAGDYRLELETLGVVAEPPGEGSDSSDESANSESAGDESAASDATEEEIQSGVEIRLALMDEKDDGALTSSGETVVTGAGAHRLRLPATPPGELALVAARADSEVALSIERRSADGAWRVIGVERGVAPAAAWPMPDDKSEWRAVVWPVGGGATPIAIAARSIDRRARGAGDITPEIVDGVTPQICVAKAATPDAALVELSAPDGVAAGSAPAQLLRAARSGPLAPQAQALWLMTRDCKTKPRVVAFEWKGEEISLDIGENERAQLPPLAAPKGKTRLWLARSAFAQPGIEAGRGMGVAPGAALALAGDTAPQLWNAGGAGAMRVALRAIDVDTRAPVSGGALFSGVIAPMTAQPVDIDKSDAPLALDLAGGVAAFTDARAIFGDGAATARILHGAGARLWLVNVGDAPLPARIARLPDAAATLNAKTAFKRFFGAGGEISLPVDAQKGDRMIVIGADATVVSQSGRVARGVDLALDGPGEAIISHKPGLVAVWIERGGAAPWPQPTARPLAPPQRVALEGAAMRFTLKGEAPVMIGASSNAPALVAFTQNGKRETLAFASGVELHRYMAAGEATLDVYAPHDGALSGTLDVSAQPVIAVHEGVNDPVAVSPGASALFSFETTRDGDIGIGVRAAPDRVSARVLDASGKILGDGVTQMLKLSQGRYFIEARVPPDAGATTIRAAIVGISPPPAAPPDEVVAELLDKAGMKKTKAK